MKDFSNIILILLIILSLNNCKISQENSNQIVESATQYVRDWGVWLFKNEEDFGKTQKEIREKVKKENKEYFEFGSKFTVLFSKAVDGKDYYRIQLPDKTEYWVEKESLVEKFIVINQSDVIAYDQPDPDYFTAIKLQPGDFGYFIKEQDGWIYVDFYAFRPHKKGEERKWVREVWIKEGYTDDLLAAKEAYYLYRAYLFTFDKRYINKEEAIKNCKNALEINAGRESEIHYIVKDFLNELQQTE